MPIRRDEDENGNRYYTDGSKKVANVSRLAKQLNDDTGGLDYWKDQNDGVGNNADWKHIFWYTRHRGTLSHSTAMEHLTNKHLWTADELSSLRAIEEVSGAEVADSTEDEVVYSILNHKDLVSTQEGFDGISGMSVKDVLQADIRWLAREFPQFAQDIGLTRDNAIHIEEYVLSYDPPYGGQVDIVYEVDGQTICADLKTSSGLREDAKYQVVAYAEAIEPEVDAVEVIRCHPDSKSMVVHTNGEERTDHHTNDYWNETYDELYAEFEELAYQHADD